jgi:putative SOS response-associated peptidase YedK
MSGKISGYQTLEELKAFFPIDNAACEATPNHDIAPAQEILAIITTRASQSFSTIHHRMPVILKPQVYKQWLDAANRNAVELIELLQNEIITEFVSYPQLTQTGAARHIDPSRTEAVGKAQQTMIVWPEHKEPSQKE